MNPMKEMKYFGQHSKLALCPTMVDRAWILSSLFGISDTVCFGVLAFLVLTVFGFFLSFALFIFI